MGRKPLSLADRFRAALDRRESQRTREEAREQRLLEEARKARADLLTELHEFAERVGYLDSRLESDTLTWSFEGKRLDWRADGDGDRVQLHWEGQAQTESNALYREAQLGFRWIWRRVKAGREYRVPLHDEGLAILLTTVLGLPDPDEGSATPPDGRSRNL